MDDDQAQELIEAVEALEAETFMASRRIAKALEEIAKAIATRALLLPGSQN